MQIRLVCALSAFVDLRPLDQPGKRIEPRTLRAAPRLVDFGQKDALREGVLLKFEETFAAEFLFGHTTVGERLALVEVRNIFRRGRPDHDLDATFLCTHFANHQSRLSEE